MLTRRYLKYLPMAVAAAGIAVLLAGTSVANDAPAGPGSDGGGHGMWGRWLFEQMDANHDGKVTQAEIAAFESARAAEIDTNHDGKITADEIQAFREKERAKREAARLARMDTNGDGVVSVEEYEAAQTWRLAHLDRNGDGVIDRDDMHRGMDGGGPGPHRRHHPWSDDGSPE